MKTHRTLREELFWQDVQETLAPTNSPTAMDVVEDPTMTGDHYSSEKQIVLNVLTICSAFLSCIGSSMVIFKIMRDRSQNGSMTPYDRIILGLSSFDVVSSITWAIWPFLLPTVTEKLWAIGNLATCQAYAFLAQVSFSAWWYNCLLSYYFLLTVLSQVWRKNFVEKCEPWLHLSVLYFPITAIMGLTRGWYGETSCWYTDPNITWVCVAIPAFFTYLSLIINYSVIYAVVRRSLKPSEHGRGLTSKQKRLKREAATSMLLYVTFFFVIASPSIVKELLYTYFGYTTEDAGTLYILKIFEAIFLPLQGFFNFFIYIKPKYTRFRAANPKKPMHFVLQQALLNPKVPQLAVSSAQPASRSIFWEEDLNQALFNSHFPQHAVDPPSEEDPVEETIEFTRDDPVGDTVDDTVDDTKVDVIEDAKDDAVDNVKEED